MIQMTQQGLDSRRAVCRVNSAMHVIEVCAVQVDGQSESELILEVRSGVIHVETMDI